MNVRSLIQLLEQCDPLHEIYLCPTVAPIDAVEQCPGDQTWGLDPYVTLHGACKYPKDHGTPDGPAFCYNHSSYYCGCLAEVVS